MSSLISYLFLYSILLWLILIINSDSIYYMKKKWFVLIILLVICTTMCVCFFSSKTNDIKIIIDNQSHDLNDVNEVVELSKKEFYNMNIKGRLLEIEYHEKDVVDLEEQLKNEYSAIDAVVIYIKFKTFLITNQSLNRNEEYTYSMEFIKKDNLWNMVNFGQG